jgi:hypothetical protein
VTTYYAKTGDVGSSVTEQLLDGEGVGVNLTSATVRFIMRAPGAAEPIVAEEAELVVAATGEVKYTWAEGDLDAAGYYIAEWEVTYSNDAVETFPADGYISVVVRDSLDIDASS